MPGTLKFLKKKLGLSKRGTPKPYEATPKPYEAHEITLSPSAPDTPTRLARMQAKRFKSFTIPEDGPLAAPERPLTLSPSMRLTRVASKRSITRTPTKRFTPTVPHKKRTARNVLEMLHEDRPTRIRALMRSVTSIGSQGCLRKVQRKDGQPMLTIVTPENMNRRIDLAYMGGDLLGYGASGVAYVSVSMTMIASVIKVGPRSPKAREEALLGMRLASDGVIKDRCPNIACTVGYFECDKALEGLQLPRMFQQINPKAFTREYSITVMELVEGGTMQETLEDGVDMNEYISIILQALLALRFMHASGYSHGDNHSGNYFINQVVPGGRWHYRLKTTDIFVPNYGIQVMLGDFGLAKPLTDADESTDLQKVFDLDISHVFPILKSIRMKMTSYIQGLKTAQLGTRADLVIEAFSKMMQVLNNANHGNTDDVLNYSGPCINASPYTCEP